jgi:hypothetical protein
MRRVGRTAMTMDNRLWEIAAYAMLAFSVAVLLGATAELIGRLV